MLLLFILLSCLGSHLYFLTYSHARSGCQYVLSRLFSWLYPISSAVTCSKMRSGDLEEKSVRSICKWRGATYAFCACLLPKFLNLQGGGIYFGSVLGLFLYAGPEILRNDKHQFLQKAYELLLCGYFRQCMIRSLIM